MAVSSTPSVATQKLIDAAVAQAQVGLVAVISKPESIAHLRATWRASAEHVTEQAKRFVRLTVVSAVPSVYSVVAGGKFDWKTLLSFIVPFAEVAWRQVFPAMGAAALDAAPGATIVPDEVGPSAIIPVADAPVLPVTEAPVITTQATPVGDAAS